jgi:hypothetical protein
LSAIISGVELTSKLASRAARSNDWRNAGSKGANKRPHLEGWKKLARYALVVTIETPGVESNIYIPVANQIGIPVVNEVQIEVP